MNLTTKKYISFTMSLALVILIGFVSYKTYNCSLVYDSQMLKEAEKNKVQQYTEQSVEGIIYLGLDKFSSFIFDDEEKKEKKKLEAIQENKNIMNQYLIYYFALIGLLLLTYFFGVDEIYVFALTSASLISWSVGILAPMLTIEVFKDLPIVGYTIFKYESKSIWTTITRLWEIDRYFISVLVGLFSIIVPVIKTIAIYVSLFYKKNLKIINFIGKWSMADVFVVALLIANFSINSDEFTDAKVQIAVYFFSIYVILSIIASFIVHKHILELDKPKQ